MAKHEQKNKYEHLDKNQLIQLILKLKHENGMLHNAKANQLEQSKKLEIDFLKKMKNLNKIKIY